MKPQSWWRRLFNMGEPKLPKKPEDVDVGQWPVYPALSFWTAEEARAVIEEHKRARFRRSGLFAFEAWADNRVDDGLRAANDDTHGVPFTPEHRQVGEARCTQRHVGGVVE